jgi:hypothetical protein
MATSQWSSPPRSFEQQLLGLDSAINPSQSRGEGVARHYCASSTNKRLSGRCRDLGDHGLPFGRHRPASVMRIRSTISVAPRCAIAGSVTTVASFASTRLESISAEKQRDKRKCSVRPLGHASISSARRCSRLKRDAEDVEGLLRRIRRM